MRRIDADALMERLFEKQREYANTPLYVAGLSDAGVLIAEAPTVEPVRDSDRLPRLLTFDEIKRIAQKEAYRIKSEEVEPVWLEEVNDGIASLNLVLISWWYDPDMPDDNPEDFNFIVKFFGTDLDDCMGYNSFGKRWRIWSARPTKEEMSAAPWQD